MKSEESARGEGRSIILFIRVLTYDYDTQTFNAMVLVWYARLFAAEERNTSRREIYYIVTKRHWRTMLYYDKIHNVYVL